MLQEHQKQMLQHGSKLMTITETDGIYHVYSEDEWMGRGKTKLKAVLAAMEMEQIVFEDKTE